MQKSLAESSWTWSWSCFSPENKGIICLQIQLSKEERTLSKLQCSLLHRCLIENCSSGILTSSCESEFLCTIYFYLESTLQYCSTKRTMTLISFGSNSIGTDWCCEWGANLSWGDSVCKKTKLSSPSSPLFFRFPFYYRFLEWVWIAWFTSLSKEWKVAF